MRDSWIFRISIIWLYSNAVNLFTKLWSPSPQPSHQFTIPESCGTFSKKYDTIQEQLQIISGVDELLSGIHAAAVFNWYIWGGNFLQLLQ